MERIKDPFKIARSKLNEFHLLIVCDNHRQLKYLTRGIYDTIPDHYVITVVTKKFRIDKLRGCRFDEVQYINCFIDYEREDFLKTRMHNHGELLAITVDKPIY
jgi:hypothetical protein